MLHFVHYCIMSLNCRRNGAHLNCGASALRGPGALRRTWGRAREACEHEASGLVGCLDVSDRSIGNVQRCELGWSWRRARCQGAQRPIPSRIILHTDRPERHVLAPCTVGTRRVASRSSSCASCSCACGADVRHRGWGPRGVRHRLQARSTVRCGVAIAAKGRHGRSRGSTLAVARP